MNIDDTEPVLPIVRTATGWRIPGRALVLSGTFRSASEAERIARRIARDESVLAACLELRMVGVLDQRPEYGADDDDVEPRAAA